METICAILSAGIIGSSIAGTIISASCKKTYDLASYIVSNPVPSSNDVKNLLEKTDIIVKIRKISKYLEDLKINNEKKYLIYAIDDIKVCINDINELLNEILEIEKVQKSLYFGNWSFRKINCSAIINKLEIKIYNLYTRFDDYCKLNAL